MTIPTPPSAARRSPELDVLEVRCWLLRDRPLIAFAASACAVAAAAVIYIVSGNLWAVVGGTTALIVAMRRIYLPIHFRLDPYGVTRRVSGQARRIPWTAVARYEAGKRGVVLFPYGADYRLAAGQGLFIPWDGCREEIEAMLVELVDSAENTSVP